MRRLLSSLAFTTAAALLAPGPARADANAADRATARALAEEGEDALEKKNYAVAADRFSRADALVHAPTLLLELARAEVGLRKFVEAQEHYQRIIREGVQAGSPPAFARAMREAEKELSAIPPKLGWVVINVEGPTSPVLTIDDAPVPQAALGVKRAVNPGSHSVKAAAEGFLPNETTFAVREGDSATVSLTLERAPVATPAMDTGPKADLTGALTTTTAAGNSDGGSAKPRTAQRTFALVALGVGAAGIVVGGVTGAIALGKHGQLVDACQAGKCQDDQQNTLDAYRSMGTVSTIGFIVGAVGGAAGVTLLLTAPHPTRKAEIRPTLGFGRVGAELVFQ